MAVSYARWTRIVRSIMSVVDIVFLTYNNMNTRHLCTYQNPITNKESVSQSCIYRNYVYDIRMITKADLPLIQGLLCYLISNRSTCYEDFSIYIMGLCMV